MTTTERDYSAEMAEVIEAALPEDGYVSAVVAADIVGKLAANDPELLNGWLHQHAAVFLAIVITKRAGAERSRAHARATSRAFSKAAERFEADGDAEHLSVFAAVHVVDEENTRKPIGAMGPDDWSFVAGAFSSSSKQLAMEAAFAAAVEKKLRRAKASRTDEVFSESAYCEMYRSITARQPKSVAA